MRVTLSPDTERDLIEIAAFIGADSPRRSMSFIYELQTLCASLATKPLRFTIIAERQSVSVRRAIQGRYSVFYVARPDEVYVLRILNSARDHEKLLFPSD